MKLVDLDPRWLLKAGGLAVVLFIADALGWLVVALISKAIELVAKKIGL